MATESKPLYAAREPIFPRRVSGFFRRLKWQIMIVTLGIYYITPWIRWDRGPDLPNQAVLVDMANSRFYFFWIEIWGHELYFVAGLLIMAGLGLFVFTSALGRVWCGYTCPQTVWTDLFILVERWIEGDRNARVKLHHAPWSARKWRLRVVKWTVWHLIGLMTGGAWVFYFADAPTLAAELATFSAPSIAYITIAILTATTFVFGGFMREQVCIYMCPWPRIQVAMMDPGTLTVGYRDWRGEPRGKHRKAEGADALGDCIDCMACVNVCPMGIDIRDGQQLACITCALCIDACDDVMGKIGKERGLIDYLSLEDVPPSNEAVAAGWTPKSVWSHILRFRTFIYFLLWGAIGVGLLVALFMRSEIELTVAPVRNPTFVTLSDGTIRNAYDVRVRNKHGEPRTFALTLSSDLPLGLSIEGDDDTVFEIATDTQLLLRVYVNAEPGSEAVGQARSALRIWVADALSGERASVDTTFNGTGAN